MALVTGGARRVGRAVALALAEAGYNVAITCHRSRDQAHELVRAIEGRGRESLMIAIDLALPDAAETVHAAFTQRFGRLDALVNNASIFEPTALGDMDVASFERHMAINARAPLMLIQSFAPLLKAGAPQRLGRVVNFIDAHVLGQPMPGYGAYSASKAALWEITRGMALELAPHVTVNAIAPGVVAWAESFNPSQRERYLERIPLARAGTPDDAAAAVRFLVQQADYMTGQVLRLDGGRTLT